jgi:hypothetical protein
MASTFEIDPADYLSIDYEAFRDDMLELALSRPAEYFELRKAVLMAVKKEACVKQYNVYYNLLTKAKKSDGSTSIFQGITEPTAADRFVPNYPKQLVNQFALGAAKTIDKISEDAVELLLPRDFKSIANERTGTKSKGLGIE